jgi:hypothetical protein
MSGPTEFDLSAAWLRRANGDMKAFVEGLAVRLEGALPGHVEVERKRDGLFSRESHVSAIVVTVEGKQYSLTFDHGRLKARRSKFVRGITIGSAELPIPEWLSTLSADIALIGRQAGDAHAVLHDFLMS